MPTKLLIVFLAGGVGSVLRYLASVGVRAWAHPPANPPAEDSALALLPLATLGVNVVGCLAIGMAFPLLQGVREETRLAIVVGLLGGFTTFSAFGHETLTLLQQGRPAWAAAYVSLSVGLGLAAAAVGHLIAARLLV